MKTQVEMVARAASARPVAVAGVAVVLAAAMRAWWRARHALLAEQSRRVKGLEDLVSRQGLALKKYEAALAELQNGGSSSPARPVLYRIVLTGGPCGGKTTALAEIKARLESLGFLILCVPEVATLLFGGGAPFPHDEASALTFQKNLLKLQLSLEEAFIELATQSGRPSVILLDRGAMDGKAYMSDDQWELLLEDVKMTPIMMRDQRYDAILHLVTAANGAESFYTLANNMARHETPEQAREMDEKTIDCWTGHEHLYIVDNTTPFEEKIRRAVARIAKLVGVPAPLAITRKFLLQKKPTHSDLQAHLKRFEEFEVDQTYLATHGANERCRIRRRQQGANVSFQHQLWVTEETPDGAETTLMERTLSAREYFTMLKQADPMRCTVSKTLTCFTWGSTYWELNSFKGASHVAILEVEAESMESLISMPDFVQVEREVTDEKSYDSFMVSEELAKSVSSEEVRGASAVEGRVTEVLTKLERESVSRKSATSSPKPSSGGEKHRSGARW